ncbi:hypothetical protein MP638_006657 [Amoeboaphelidium occidentale]|nr:hypothetical protein MP638_006657 [Amoeboaphelidium occidentale]
MAEDQSILIFFTFCIIATFVLFVSLIFSGRLLAKLVNVTLLVLLKKSRTELSFDSLKVAPLRGRILFKNFRYQSINQCITIVDGYITVLYWRKLVEKNFSGPSDLKLPCRIHVSARGVEWFMYNRTPAYDYVEKCLNELDIQDKIERGEKIQVKEKAKPVTTSPDSLWYKLLPLSLSVTKGAIVIGNTFTTSLLSLEFQNGGGMYKIYKSRSKYDLGKYVLDLKFVKPKVSLNENPDYGKKLSHSISGQNVGAMSQRGKTDDFHMLNSKTWHGLSRYQKATAAHEQSSNYAKVKRIAEASILHLKYYSDDAGIVQGKGSSFVSENLFHSANGDLSPEWGVDLNFKDAIINYGPWANHERGILMEYFYPFARRSFPPTPLPEEGDLRLNIAMVVHIQFEGETVLKIPFKEKSKDDKYPAPELDTEEEKVQTKRPFGWLELKLASGTTVSINTPMVYYENGYTTTVELKSSNVTCSSSVNYAELLSAQSVKFGMKMAGPIQWNDIYKWNILVDLMNPTIFLLREHVTLFQDLASDWTSGPSWTTEDFLPYKYNISIALNNMKLYLCANEKNIISQPNDLSDNLFVVVASEKIKFDVAMDFTALDSLHVAIPVSMQMKDINVSLSLPKTNTIGSFISEEFKTMAKADKIMGSFEYDYCTEYFDGIEKRDHLNVDLTGESMELVLYGYFIRLLFFLRDNYAGSYLNFCTLDEYKRKTSMPLDLKREFLTNNSDFEAYFRFNGSGLKLIFPELMYSNDKVVEAFCEDVDVYLMNLESLSDYQIDFSPIVLKKDDSSLLVDGFTLRNHWLLGPPPSYSTILIDWAFRVHAISGNFTVGFDRALVQWTKSFMFLMADEDNCLPENLTQKDLSITWLDVHIDSIDVTLLGYDEGLALSLNIDRGIRISFNNLLLNGTKPGTYVQVPNLQMKLLSLYKDGNEINWNEIGSFELLNVQTNTDFATENTEDEQMAFIKLLDSRLKRVPYLYEDTNEAVDLWYYPAFNASTCCRNSEQIPLVPDFDRYSRENWQVLNSKTLLGKNGQVWIPPGFLVEQASNVRNSEQMKKFTSHISRTTKYGEHSFSTSVFDFKPKQDRNKSMSMSRKYTGLDVNENMEFKLPMRNANIATMASCDELHLMFSVGAMELIKTINKPDSDENYLFESFVLESYEILKENPVNYASTSINFMARSTRIEIILPVESKSCSTIILSKNLEIGLSSDNKRKSASLMVADCKVTSQLDQMMDLTSSKLLTTESPDHFISGALLECHLPESILLDFCSKNLPELHLNVINIVSQSIHIKVGKHIKLLFDSIDKSLQIDDFVSHFNSEKNDRVGRFLLSLARIGNQGDVGDPEFMVRPSNLWRYKSTKSQQTDEWKIINHLLFINHLRLKKTIGEDPNTKEDYTYDKLLEALKPWHHWELADLRSNKVLKRFDLSSSLTNSDQLINSHTIFKLTMKETISVSIQADGQESSVSLEDCVGEFEIMQSFNEGDLKQINYNAIVDSVALDLKPSLLDFVSRLIKEDRATNTGGPDPAKNNVMIGGLLAINTFETNVSYYEWDILEVRIHYLVHSITSANVYTASSSLISHSISAQTLRALIKDVKRLVSLDIDEICILKSTTYNMLTKASDADKTSCFASKVDINLLETAVALLTFYFEKIRNISETVRKKLGGKNAPEDAFVNGFQDVYVSQLAIYANRLISSSPCNVSYFAEQLWAHSPFNKHVYLKIAKQHFIAGNLIYNMLPSVCFTLSEENSNLLLGNLKIGFDLSTVEKFQGFYNSILENEIQDLKDLITYYNGNSTLNMAEISQPRKPQTKLVSLASAVVSLRVSDDLELAIRLKEVYLNLIQESIDVFKIAVCMKHFGSVLFDIKKTILAQVDSDLCIGFVSEYDSQEINLEINQIIAVLDARRAFRGIETLRYAIVEKTMMLQKILNEVTGKSPANEASLSKMKVRGILNKISVCHIVAPKTTSLQQKDIIALCLNVLNLSLLAVQTEKSMLCRMRASSVSAKAHLDDFNPFLKESYFVTSILEDSDRIAVHGVDLDMLYSKSLSFRFGISEEYNGSLDLISLDRIRTLMETVVMNYQTSSETKRGTFIPMSGCVSIPQGTLRLQEEFGSQSAFVKLPPIYVYSSSRLTRIQVRNDLIKNFNTFNPSSLAILLKFAEALQKLPKQNGKAMRDVDNSGTGLSVLMDLYPMKVSLTCLPHSKVECVLETTMVSVSVFKDGLSASLEKAGLRLRHEYAPEDCLTLSFHGMSLLYGSIDSSSSALSTTIQQVSLKHNIRHLQDFYLFMHYFQDVFASFSQQSELPQHSNNPFYSTVKVSKMDLSADLTQAIGKVVLSLQNLKARACTHLDGGRIIYAGSELIELHSEGRLSGIVLGLVNSELIISSRPLGLSEQSPKRNDTKSYTAAYFCVKRILTMLEFNLDRILVLDVNPVELSVRDQLETKTLVSAPSDVIRLNAECFVGAVHGIVSKNMVPCFLKLSEKLKSLIDEKRRMALVSPESPFSSAGSVKSNISSLNYHVLFGDRVIPITSSFALKLEDIKLAFFKEQFDPFQDCIEITAKNILAEFHHSQNMAALQRELNFNMSLRITIRKGHNRQKDEKKFMDVNQWSVSRWNEHVSSRSFKLILDVPPSDFFMESFTKSGKSGQNMVDYTWNSSFSGPIDVNLNLGFFNFFREIANEFGEQFTQYLDEARLRFELTGNLNDISTGSINNVQAESPESSRFKQSQSKFNALKPVQLDPQLKVIEGATTDDLFLWLGVHKESIPPAVYTNITLNIESMLHPIVGSYVQYLMKK